MDIKYTDKDGFIRSVEETLNDLLAYSNHFSNNITTLKAEITKLQQENNTLRCDYINLQQDFSDTKTMILRLQEQQNNNHMTIWETIKKLFKPNKLSNITTSEVDLTK